MNNITISAPGKLMLFGEHAVVYNRPCLVTAVNQRMKVTVELLDTPDFHVEAPDVQITGYTKPLASLGQGDIPKGAKFVEIAIKNVFAYIGHPDHPSCHPDHQSCHPERSEGSHSTNNLSIERDSSLLQDSAQNDKKRVQHDKGIGLRVTTASEFSSQFGFGSSSASTVCTVKAMSELFDLHLTQRQIFEIAYKTVLDIQGKGSGFDVAVATYGGTLFFVTGGEIIEPLSLDALPLVVGYSGVKADTVPLINQVKEKAEKYEEVVLYAKNALLAKDFATVGELMNINQGFLASLGVSTKKLEDMIYGAREGGAYGAKLSGAGGGDCIIACVSEDKKEAVQQGIIQAGGEIIAVAANAEGVRVEQ
jgi:mevalonate kinase